jgi:Zn-dependent protease
MFLLFIKEKKVSFAIGSDIRWYNVKVMLIQLLFNNPIVFIFLAGALVISITIHEFAHAFSALKLGDPTAKLLGRVTLNPLAHLDPLGTLFLLMAGFGWGRPVPFDARNLHNPKRDSAIISFAGPLSNFILAILLALILKVLSPSEILSVFLYFAIFYNLILGFFNLIPLHPLDGFKVLYGILPLELAWQWKQTQRYGIYILMLLVFTRTTSVILEPLVFTSMRFLGLQVQ